MRSLTLTLLLAMLVPALQADSHPGVLMKRSAPEAEVLDGYNRGHCVSLYHQVRVCKQLSDERDVFVVEKSGKQVGVWPTRTYLGETSDFEVLTADFEHDGRAEMIVANRDSTSNGMGIDFWTISIYPDAAFGTVAEPLTFSVEEYGSFGTFVVDKNAFVNILTTRWVWTRDPKGKRDTGVYLVGQWWRYEAGELVPQTNRATLARRYLFSFANERGETSGSANVPYRWLKSARAEKFKSEQITGASSESQPGVVQDVSTPTKTGIERSVTITFKTDNGPTSTFTYPDTEYQPNEDGELDFIGDAASGRIYPARYLPARIDSWLKGKRATLRFYGDGARSEKILWLER